MLKRFFDWVIETASTSPAKRRLIQLAIFVIIVSPLIVLTTWGYVKTKRDLTNFILARRLSLAQLGAIALEGKFDQLTDLGVSLATRVRFRQLIGEGRWQEAVRILESVPRDFPSVERILLADPSGTLMADTPAIPSVKGQNFAFRDWYKGVSKSWSPYVSEVYQRTAEPRYNVVAIAAPIKNEAQQVLGILVMQVRADQFFDWAKDIEVGLEGFIHFVDRRGHVVAHPRVPAQGEIVDFSDVPFVAKALQGGNGIEITVNPIDKDEQVVAYYATAPTYGWVVIAQQPVAAAFQGRDSQLQFLLLRFAITLLLYAFIIYVVIRLGDTILQYRQKERTFLESIGDGVVAIDRSWHITLWNRAAAELTGWSGEEVMGKPLRDFLKFVRGGDSREDVGFVEDAMVYGEKRFMGKDMFLVKKNGTRINVGDSASPIFNGNRTVAGAIVVFRDISKDYELEKAREEFASLASHQLRAPVTTIKGYTEMLLEERKLDRESRSKIEEMQKAAQNLNSLVNALLNVSRFELGTIAIQPEPQHVPDIADQVVKGLMPQVEEKALNLVKNYAKDLPSVSVDPKLMEAIFQNLLSNAVRYTPNGGTVTVEISKQAGDILIRVSDTGYGIPKDQQVKLFTKFFRADNVREKVSEGTGLGLYLVKSIVEQGGGKIWFESEENKGTTFYVSIPLSGMKRREGAKGLT